MQSDSLNLSFVIELQNLTSTAYMVLPFYFCFSLASCLLMNNVSLPFKCLGMKVVLV